MVRHHPQVGDCHEPKEREKAMNPRRAWIRTALVVVVVLPPLPLPRPEYLAGLLKRKKPREV